MAARYLSITKSSSAFGIGTSGRRRARTINRSYSTGPVTIGVVVVLLVAFLGIVYLVQSNSVSTAGYQIRDLENRIAELETTNDELRLEAAELQSLKNLEEVKDDLKMVSNTQVNYVGGNSKVASR